MAGGVLAQLLGGERPLADDDRRHLLAPGLARATDHRRFAHLGMALERLLDLARVDVVAAGDDQVLAAADQRQVAVIVVLAEVAGANQPSALNASASASGRSW